MRQLYTIKSAVTDVLGTIPYDKEFSFVSFYWQVLAELHINGNPAHPMDSTVSREFRRCKKDFDVVLVNCRKSTWMRKSEER